MCRARLTNDGEVRISTSYTASKLLFNLDCPETTSFKETMPQFFSSVRSISSNSKFSSSGSLVDSASQEIRITTLKEIYAKREEGEYYVAGEIVSLGDAGEWCFTGCVLTRYGRKLTPNGEYMRCKACDRDRQTGVIKYKLIVNIMDEELDAPILLWDKVCFELLGVSTGDLKKKHGEGNFLNLFETICGF